LKREFLKKGVLGVGDGIKQRERKRNPLAGNRFY